MSVNSISLVRLIENKKLTQKLSQQRYKKSDLKMNSERSKLKIAVHSLIQGVEIEKLTQK